MVTFAQLRSTSFESLDHAGDTWTGVSGHMEHLAGQLRSGVLHPLTGGSSSPYAPPSGNRPWTGAAADEAAREIGFLADEMAAFHFEALAISAALHRANKAFAEAKQKLLRAIGDAEGLGATVAEDGAVTLPDLPPEERNDPEAIAHQKRKWNELQQHVQVMTAAVTAATEADNAVATALLALNPEEVDPAKHPDTVRNAEDDVMRAVGMPKDRKDVPDWWANVDPAVRAQLLATNPKSLVDAGVLDPTYKWRAPNDGAGPYHVREPGVEERGIQAETYALVAGGTLLQNVDAARHMQHYLDNTGEPLTVDVDRMLRDDPMFRAHVGKLLSDSENDWRQTALDAYNKAGGAPVAIPVETQRRHENDFTFDPDRQPNWFHAIGSQACIVSGVVTVNPGPDGKPVVSTQYQVNVWDRYNWDKGKSTNIAGTNITDADMAKLHQTGLAQEYDISGRSTPMTWGGSGGAPMHPAGSGERNADREGGRTDPGRETR